jgi:hypothetical protein
LPLGIYILLVTVAVTALLIWRSVWKARRAAHAAHLQRLNTILNGAREYLRTMWS